MLKRPSSTSMLQQPLIPLALPEAEWLSTRRFIKSHSSLLGECFHRSCHLRRSGNRCHSWCELDEDASSCVGHLHSSGSPRLSYLWQGFSAVATCHSSPESVYAVVAKSLNEILVVREYPDVCPDDLPGLPPDRAIEFKIEL
jgi:hypothetical protein